MKTIQQLFIVLCFAFFVLPYSSAQKSIKQGQQVTDFFYTQINLNGGLLFDQGPHLLFSKRSPYSNINFTYRSKNQRLLQQGYTKFLHLNAYKANFALVFKNATDEEGHNSPQLSLQMRDFWLKLNTKWDRTSLKIGHFSLPYGHAPKMDLDNSFVPALASQDLGFNRDFGILFKTPTCQTYDLEVAFTLGGAVPTTLLNYTLPMNEESQENNFQQAQFNYQGTWLATARLGTPTFRKQEWGLLVAIGNVRQTTAIAEQSKVFRLGADWTYKHKERFRMTNQILTGYTITEAGTSGWNFHQKTELDYFWKRQWILSFSNSVQFQSYAPQDRFQGISVGKLAYALNPHTRLKVNAYTSYHRAEGNQAAGVFLQLVAGFGKRG